MLARFLSAPLLIAVIAIAMGSGIDALIKGIAPGAGLHHLLAWRFLFGALIALSVFRVQKRPMPSREAIRFHTLRSLLQLTCAFTFFYAIMQLPLAEATIIGFTAALMVPLVARVLLNEKLTPVIMIASVIGFAGAALAVSGTPAVANPDANRSLGLIACFIAAFLYALVLVMLRMRATREDATTIAMFTNLVPAIILLPITIGFPLIAALPDSVLGSVPGISAPNWADLPLFLLLGMLGYSVWYLMTLAYARAPAQRLAPLEYTALIWSALFGAVFFFETPGWQLWAGAGVIITACLIVAFDSRFITRKQTGLPTSDLPE